MADITVEVSSPGLIAYGANSWGSFNYGGFDQIDVTVGSVDAFNTEGWGANQWGYLVWGQSFEDASAQVTAPGTPTTWGQSTYGNYSWGQITGTQSEIGDESIYNEQNAEAFASTNLLILSITTTTITADANLNLFTNLLNIEEGFAQENVDANTIIEVTAPGQLPWGTTSWGYGSWGNIGGMDVEQGGEEVVVPSIEVDVIGNQLNTTIGAHSITADANLTLNTNLLNVSLGDEDAIPNTIVTLSTNLLTVSVGIASGEGLSTVELTGVNMTVSTGRIFIAAWAVVDIGVTNTWSVVDIAA